MIKSFCLKKAFLLLTGIFFISGFIQAQSIAISGSVSDGTTGDLLPGVSVIIKGTTTGSITNFDGVYNLNVNQGDILVYSFIGYVPQEVTIAQQSQLNIQLKPDVVGVDEVVVIGYGSVKKEDATGSISAVSAKDFNAGAIASPQDLIVGKTAGVQITSTGGAPGAGSTIRIRGGSSLNASNDPLIVIDGVPIDTEGVEGMQNPLNTVNPNDIETFTVLKDASATAIYGSRASNGVIIITTKKGKSGDVVKFNYTGNVSIASAANTLDMMDASQYTSFIKDTYGEDSDAYRNVTNPAYAGVNTNWQDEIYRTAIGTDHNLSVSGGVKDLPYRLSFGYTNQEGIVETSAMERITLGLNLNPTFFDDHLKVAINTKYMHVKNNFSNDDAVGTGVSFDPTKPVYDETTGSKYGGYYTWIDSEGNPVTIAPMNPVAQLMMHDNSSKVNRYILNAKFDYKLHFAPTITATVNMGVDGSTSEGRTIVQPEAAWSSPNDPERAGEYSPYNQDKNNKTLDMYLTYNEVFGKHNVKAMGGYAWQHFHREGDNVTYNYAQTNEVTPFRAYEAQNYLVSFFGRAEYNYDNRYLVNATVRADGTSRFSEENRWGYFPAVGLAWRIKNEAFMTDIDWLSDLKLRLGWGVTGQQGVTDDLPYQGAYIRSNGTAMYPWDGGYVNTMRPDAYDENIKWEETTTYNAGIDFGLLNNKIAGSFEFYHRVTDDLLNVVPVAAGANLSNEILTNIGSLENTGVEFNLTYRAIAKEDLFWEIGGNLTYNQNQITSLTNGDDPTYLGIQTGGISGGTGNNVQIHSVGYPSNSFFVYQQVYDDNGNPLEGVYVDQNGDGIYNDFDKIRVGQAAPKLMVGINSRLEYKQWDFAFSGRMQFGATVYNDNRSTLGVSQDTYNSGGNFLTNRLPSASTGFNTFQYWSSEYLEDASFFRMDNITAGYNFKKLGNTDMSLRVSGTAQNVFVITQYDGVDPEVQGGIDNNYYPRPRTFILGVNLNF